MGFAQNRDSVAMVSNSLYTIGLLFGVPRHSSFFLETRSLGSGGGGGGFASASGWLSQRLTSCRCCLSSSWCSAASCPLMPPLPFASCMPPLQFASCLPAGCHVALVVASPPTPPCNFASTSSSPSGCRDSQRPTYRDTASSRPLAAFASRCAASASWRIAASQLAVSWSPSPMRRRHCQ